MRGRISERGRDRESEPKKARRGERVKESDKEGENEIEGK